MGDHGLIQYYAQKNGYCGKGKNFIFTIIEYGNATCALLFYFEKGKSTLLEVNIDEIYEYYGKQYGSVEKFATAFVAKYSYYKFEKQGKKCYLEIDLRKNVLQKVASVGLANLGMLIFTFNEFLNKDMPTFGEEYVRKINKEYLAREVKKNKSISLLGLLCFVVGIVGALVLQFFENLQLLIVFAEIIMFGGMGLGLFFLVRTITFNFQLKKAISNKSYK